MNGALTKIFDKEPVNTGRQPELDIAKAFLIFHLAPVHAIIESLSEEALAHGPAYFFDSIVGGIFGAPMFMFCMGVSMVYTRNPKPMRIAMRGLSILVIGLILNVFRYLIPFLAGYLISGDTETFLEPLPYMFFGNDILQFAGLAMLIMALLHQITEMLWVRGVPARRITSGIAVLVVALAMSIGGTTIIGTDMGNPVSNVLFGWLIGTEDAAGMVWSDFPLFQWFIFPAVGALFGELLIRTKDKARLYGVISSVCAVIAVLGMVYGISGRRGMFGEGQMCFQHLTFTDAMLALAGNVAALGLWYAVSGLLTDKVNGFLNAVSETINVSYCIHWVWVSCICMVAFPILGWEPGFWPVLALGIAIAFVSTATGFKYIKYKKARWKAS